MKGARGFTLFEMIVTLSLIAILIPGFIFSKHYIVTRNHARVMGQQLFQAIMTAREQALVSHHQVTLSKKTAWEKGFQVIVNKKIYLEIVSEKKPTFNIHWRSFPLNKDRLDFVANGFTNFENGTFWLCLMHSSNPEWAIMVSKSGKAHQLFPDKKGMILDHLGEPLSC